MASYDRASNIHPALPLDSPAPGADAPPVAVQSDSVAACTLNSAASRRPHAQHTSKSSVGFDRSLV